MNTAITTKRLLIGIGGAVLLAVVLVACGGGTDATADQSDGRASLLGLGVGSAIAWTPGSVTYTVAPGTQKQLTLSFAPSVNIASATLGVVPALRSLVSVSPSTFTALKKGESVTITLTFAPVVTSPLAVAEGTLQLSSAGGSTIAKPLPIQVIVATGATGVLPPDPGAAGKATLAGVDTDGDGVRDDIQRYIWLTYPQSQKLRAGLTDFAKGLQSAMIDTATAEAALLASGTLDKAQDCLWYLRGSDSIPIWQALRALSLNSQERSRAYRKHNALLNSMVFESTPFDQRKARCSADPDSLPN